MSTERDATRIVRSWLEDGVDALPDRVLDAVLAELPATPQRRAGWAPHSSLMRAVGVGLAAAVVVAIAALLGLRLLPGSNVGGPPTQTPVQSGFLGAWEATDPGDGSQLRVQITGWPDVEVTYTDSVATRACAEFTARTLTFRMVGRVIGNRLASDTQTMHCGTEEGSLPEPLTWTLLDHDNEDPSDDVLVNSSGEEFARAE